ncbi:hypothetical protein KCU78_g49, partial [Aureobasidium melanogenum]
MQNSSEHSPKSGGGLLSRSWSTREPFSENQYGKKARRTQHDASYGACLLFTRGETMARKVYRILWDSSRTLHIDVCFMTI